MYNNDILRAIRYTFDFSDPKLQELFQMGGSAASRGQIDAWLKKEGQNGFVVCTDREIACFLNGLITKNRGPKEGGPAPVADTMTNNMKLMKLKIALNLKAEEVLHILQLADCHISKHELSAFFRKPGHKHYRKCLDQVVRKFLLGINRQYREKAACSPA